MLEFIIAVLLILWLVGAFSREDVQGEEVILCVSCLWLLLFLL